MRIIRVSNQYKKDLELARKRNLPIEKLNAIIVSLAQDVPLPFSNKDHQLKGYSPAVRECHIQPDWLLIYRKEDDGDLQLLQLLRTGSHSDLFK